MVIQTCTIQKYVNIQICTIQKYGFVKKKKKGKKVSGKPLIRETVKFVTRDTIKKRGRAKSRSLTEW